MRRTKNKRKVCRFGILETLETRHLLAADVAITEFMAANQNTIQDGFGSSADWIELFNAGDQQADLSGHHLTDDEDNLNKWSFQDGTSIDPGQYLLVYASGFDTVDADGNQHSNFRLNPAGDYIALTDPELAVVSEFGSQAKNYPDQFADISYGSAGSVTGFFSKPTPGQANDSQVLNIGPSLSKVTRNLDPISSSENLTITATVARYQTDIADVTMTYRVMYGDEIQLAMKDDGDLSSSGDTTAGDGVYSAIIPAEELNTGQMVRWFVSSSDTDENTSRAPAFLDNSGSDRSPEYYGTIVADDTIQSNLNVWQWFIDPANQRRADTTSGTRSSLYYNGEFYDNVYVRVRGGSSTNLQKKSYKFDFNTANDFRFDPDFGRVREINLNTTFSNKDYVRQALTFETYDKAGLPGSEAFPVRVQQNGEFFSVAIVVEQPDAQMLEREDLDPEGALYKMFNRFQRGTAEKKTRTYENNSDLNAIIDPINQLTGEALKNYVFDHINIPDLLNYLAATVITQNNDQMAKNYFAYRDTNGTGEWSLFPWDLDLVFGLHFMSNDSILDDQIWADKDGFTTFANATIWPSHPFVGDQAHPGNRSWNRLMDALYRVPEFREMYLRRLRTLMDELLQPPETPSPELKFEARLDEYVALIGQDAQLDYEKWANPWSYGDDLSFEQAIQRIKNEYLKVRRVHLYETHNIDNQVPVELKSIIGQFAAASYFVPGDDSLADSWTAVGFDDAAWQTGTTGIGFENTPRNFIDLIKTRVKPVETVADGTSIFVRIPFTIDAPSQIEDLTLRMRYDDGFVAYLNGVEVERANLRTDGPQSYNSRARGRANSLVVDPEEFIISDHIDVLRTGENVLAIHVLNSSATGSDLLILPELIDGAIKTTDVAGIPHAQPDDFAINISSDIDFDPVSGNQDEEYLVISNANDFAVDISGWKLEGSAHTTFRPGVVIPSSGQLYVSPNVTAFRNRGEGPGGNQGNLIQSYSGRLANGGDTIRLLNTAGNLVSELTYAGSITSDQQSLRVTEINYNPYDALLAFGEQDTDNDSFEYLEVANTGDKAVELSGVQFKELEIEAGTEGITFTFSATSLNPGERIVVVKNRSSFESRYGTGINIAGEFVGKLSNGGETITLVDSSGDVIQQFRYNDRNGWPVRADGRGSSLEIIDPSGDYHLPENWRASVEFLGSPTHVGSNQKFGVVINEVQSRTEAPDLDRIELYNSSDMSVDIGNWLLTDGADVFKFKIAVGTSLPPGGYLVFDERQLGFGWKGTEPDDATLISVDNDGRPQLFVDSIDFAAGEIEKSWARSPNGSGPMTLRTPSFGAANAGHTLGDFNNDSMLDVRDIDLLCQELRSDSKHVEFDLTSDAKVDGDDLDHMIQDILKTSYGDTDLDGLFNSGDLVRVFQAGKYDNPLGEAGWAEGDWNCDGKFDSSDLVVAFQKGIYSTQ